MALPRNAAAILAMSGLLLAPGCADTDAGKDRTFTTVFGFGGAGTAAGAAVGAIAGGIVGAGAMTGGAFALAGGQVHDPDEADHEDRPAPAPPPPGDRSP